MERIVSKPANEKYRDNYDKIFGKGKVTFIKESDMTTSSKKFTEDMRSVFDKIRGTDIVVNKKDISEG